MFLERGLAGATIEEITERADLGKGTFYIYFSSKVAIFESVVASCLEELMAQVREVENSAADLRTALAKVVEAESAYRERDPGGFRLIVLARSLLLLNEAELPEVRSLFDRYFATLERIIRRYARAPMDPAYLRRVVIMLTNISSGYLSCTALGPAADEAGVAYTRVAEVMLDAVRDLVDSAQDQNAAPGGEVVSPSPTACLPEEPV